MPPAREGSEIAVMPLQQVRDAPSFADSPMSVPCDGTHNAPEVFYTPRMQAHSTPTVLTDPQVPTTLVVLGNITMSRRSSRVIKGQTSRFQDYVSGE